MCCEMIHPALQLNYSQMQILSIHLLKKRLAKAENQIYHSQAFTQRIKNHKFQIDFNPNAH